MDLTKLLKKYNDVETAKFLNVSSTMIGLYRKGVIPRYKQIEKFSKLTKGKINFNLWFSNKKYKKETNNAK